MEKKSNRNLAYILSTTIQSEDLEKASGGKAHLSTHQSVKLTGSSIHDTDVLYDVTADM